VFALGGTWSQDPTTEHVGGRLEVREEEETLSFR
jgi:hypothetical protein